MSSKANIEAPITRRRACAICVRPSAGGFEMLMVELHDRISGLSFLTPPGGGIEPGEPPLVAALRETKEETGYAVRLMSEYQEKLDASYLFIWEGRAYDCETSFFLVELIDPAAAPAPVTDTDYNRGASWVALEKVSDVLAFMPVPRDAVMAALRPWQER